MRTYKYIVFYYTYNILIQIDSPIYLFFLAPSWIITLVPAKSLSSLKVSLILNYPVYTFTIPVYINSDTWFLFIFAEPIPGSTWHLQSISWNTPYLPKRTEKYQRGNEAIVCTCRWLQKKWIIWKPRTRSNPNVAWPHSVCNTLHCFQNTIIPRVGHLSLMG